MNQADKDNLSYIYELDQFKSFRKLCKKLQTDTLNLLAKKNANDVAGVAMLQGQYYAIWALLKEMEKIHKASMKES